MAGIAHKDLTDPQLHEPKGASTATSGSTIFSTGSGETEWRPITPDDLSFEREVVEDVDASTVTAGSQISTAGMSATVDGTLIDAATFTIANKNTKELATKHNELVMKFNSLLLEHQSLIVSVNNIITALKTEGLLNNEQN